MEVVQSKTMGFCMGVSRVVDLAHTCFTVAAEKHLPVYSIGWFIHNQGVMEDFAMKGMKHIERPEDGPPGVGLIRAHGIPDPLRKAFIDAGFTLIDGTCRNVENSQNIIRSVSDRTTVVVAGIVGHSEVVALSGVWNKTGKIVPCLMVQSVEDVEKLPPPKGKYLLMTQTTLPSMQYKDILQAMKDRFGQKFTIGNHLCPGALRRNKALEELCGQVEAVVVVGGRISANTISLVKIVKEHGLPAWHVESASEVTDDMRAFSRVGLTAGTSTPQTDIEAVLCALKGERL